MCYELISVFIFYS